MTDTRPTLSTIEALQATYLAGGQSKAARTRTIAALTEARYAVYGSPIRHALDLAVIQQTVAAMQEAWAAHQADEQDGDLRMAWFTAMASFTSTMERHGFSRADSHHIIRSRVQRT